jgi:hypothetical protein
MTTDNFCFYLQNRLIQTSQTGGQWYSDIPCFGCSMDKHKLTGQNWAEFLTLGLGVLVYAIEMDA